MTNELRWHAEREQIREALHAAHDADLGAVATDLRRACDVLTADNAHLRALLSTARYLSSEAVRGTPSTDVPFPDTGVLLDGETNRLVDPLDETLTSLACGAHLGKDSLVIDACASVAHETDRPMGQVLAEYLALHHPQQGHGTSEPQPTEPQK